MRFILYSLAVFLVCLGIRAQTPTPFSVTIQEPCYTSAGVYSSGQLIRQLWARVYCPTNGIYQNVWDGYDQFSNVAPSGTYEIKVMQNNVHYVDEGAIGNTSSNMWGPTVHSGFYPMLTMTTSGATNFYASGYNEGHYWFRSFLTNTPQLVQSNLGWNFANGNFTIQPGLSALSWQFSACDSNWVYFACPATYGPTNTTSPTYPGIIDAQIISSYAQAYFSNGTPVTNALGAERIQAPRSPMAYP